MNKHRKEEVSTGEIQVAENQGKENKRRKKKVSVAGEERETGDQYTSRCSLRSVCRLCRSFAIHEALH